MSYGFHYGSFTFVCTLFLNISKLGLWTKTIDNEIFLKYIFDVLQIIV